MSGKLTPRDILTNPVTAGASVFTTLTLLLNIHSVDVLAMFFWTNMAELSTVAGIFAFTVLPEISFGVVTIPVIGTTIDFGVIPQLAKMAAIVLFAGYGLRLLLRLYNNLTERLT